MVKEFDAHALSQKMNSQAVRLIDVRTSEEVKQLRIPKAEHIPMHLIPINLDQLDQDTATVFYCRTGNRSARVVRFLMQQGFRQVFNLRGGLLDWASMGFALDDVRLVEPGPAP